MFTIDDLERCFKEAKRVNANWLATVIITPNCKSGYLTLIPNDNFSAKLEYYKKVYDFELNLKTCKDVKIVGFTFGDSLKEIEELLFFDEE